MQRTTLIKKFFMLYWRTPSYSEWAVCLGREQLGHLSVQGGLLLA